MMRSNINKIERIWRKTLCNNKCSQMKFVWNRNGVGRHEDKAAIRTRWSEHMMSHATAHIHMCFSLLENIYYRKVCYLRLAQQFYYILNSSAIPFDIRTNNVRQPPFTSFATMSWCLVFFSCFRGFILLCRATNYLQQRWATLQVAPPNGCTNAHPIPSPFHRHEIFCE